jgi:hypothetical protein
MTVHGVIEMYDTAAITARVNFFFTAIYSKLYEYCDQNPLNGPGTMPLELIAANRGSGGTGDLDAPPSFGDGAFAVFRWKKSGETGITTTRTHSIYLLIQYAGSGAISTVAPAFIFSNPGYTQCVGIAVAMGDDGAGNDTSPWTGTTNASSGAVAAANDTKGATPGTGPVWDATKRYVLPRSNAADGPRASDTADMIPIFTNIDGYSAQTRCHMVFDENNFAAVTSWVDNGKYMFSGFFTGTPDTGIDLPVPQVSMIFNQVEAALASTAYPNYNPYNSTQNGGTLGLIDVGPPRSFDSVNLYIGAPPYQDSPYQPNKQLSPISYNAGPWTTAVSDTDGLNGRTGVLGSFLLGTSKVLTHSTNVGLTLAVFQIVTDPNYPSVVLPWDGATTPGLNITPGTYVSF